MKKHAILSLVLAVAMILSMTPAWSVAEADEPVTLKMFIRNQSKYTGLQEDPVAQYIEQKLGIRIELTVDSSLGGTTAQTSTFNELLAVKLATNDLDDIMDFGSAIGNAEVMNNLQKAVEAGMLIPLDDLIEQYAPNLANDPRMKIRNDYRRQFMYSDGKVYSVGGWGGMGVDQLPGSANWVRWDLYKQLGYPEVRTDDDFLALLKQMQELFPTTPAGDTVYGLGGGFADAQGMGDGFVNRDYPLSKGFEPLEGSYAVYFDHANRNVATPLSDPNSFFWNGVKMFYHANQLGLLDPGAMAMSGSEYSEKINKGVYLGTVNGWGVMNKEQILANDGIENAGYMPLNMLDDVNSMTVYWESVTGCNEFAITRNCKNPEKAIEFLDWCMSEEGSRIITQGAEGLAWVTQENGEPALTDEFKVDNAGGVADMAEKYGKWKYAGINAYQHIDVDSNGYYIQPEQIPDVESYSAVKKDALTYYGADSFTDYFTQYVNRDGVTLPCVIWGSYAGAIGAKPDDIKQKSAQINEYMFKTVFKMVYAEDDATYEAIQQEAISELANLGLADVENWYTDRFVTVKAEMDPIIEQALTAYHVGK